MKILFILALLILTACSTVSKEEQEMRLNNLKNLRQFHHSV